MSPFRVRYEHSLMLLCDAFLWALRQTERIRIPGTKGHKI